MPVHSITIFTLAYLLPLPLAQLPQQKTPFKLAILYNKSIADAHPSFLLKEAILSGFPWDNMVIWGIWESYIVVRLGNCIFKRQMYATLVQYESRSTTSFGMKFYITHIFLNTNCTGWWVGDKQVYRSCYSYMFSLSHGLIIYGVLALSHVIRHVPWSSQTMVSEEPKTVCRVSVDNEFRNVQRC